MVSEKLRCGPAAKMLEVNGNVLIGPSGRFDSKYLRSRRRCKIKETPSTNCVSGLT